MRTPAWLLLAAVLSYGTACGPRDAPGIETITEVSLAADLHALAHDSMQGRLVGTPAISQAAEWIAERFAALGLVPAGEDGSWFQRVDLTWFSPGRGLA